MSTPHYKRDKRPRDSSSTPDHSGDRKRPTTHITGSGSRYADHKHSGGSPRYSNQNRGGGDLYYRDTAPQGMNASNSSHKERSQSRSYRSDFGDNTHKQDRSYSSSPRYSQSPYHGGHHHSTPTHSHATSSTTPQVSSHACTPHARNQHRGTSTPLNTPITGSKPPLPQRSSSLSQLQSHSNQGNPQMNRVSSTPTSFQERHIHSTSPRLDTSTFCDVNVKPFRINIKGLSEKLTSTLDTYVKVMNFTCLDALTKYGFDYPSDGFETLEKIAEDVHESKHNVQSDQPVPITESRDVRRSGGRKRASRFSDFPPTPMA